MAGLLRQRTDSAADGEERLSRHGATRQREQAFSTPYTDAANQGSPWSKH